MKGKEKQGKTPIPDNNYGSPNEESNRLFAKIRGVKRGAFVRLKNG